MKTAREWFEKLRPDLRDRAIRNGKEYPWYGLDFLYDRFSLAILYCFYWRYDQDFWEEIYWEARDIEEGRKPDIKPKKK